MRLAVAFFAALLLTLAVLAGQSRGQAAPQARTSAMAMAMPGEAAADPRPCHAFVHTEAPLVAGASEARDMPLEVEDSTEVVAVGPDTAGSAAQPPARATVSARDAPLHWLDGLLRPPRTLNG